METPTYSQMVCENRPTAHSYQVNLKPLIKRAVAAFPRRTSVPQTPSYVTAPQLPRRFGPPEIVINLGAETFGRPKRKPGFMPLRDVA